MPLSNALERELLLRYIGSGKDVRMSLHTGTTYPSTGQNEITQAANRPQVTFQVPSNGTYASNTNEIRIVDLTPQSATVNYYGLWSNGTLFWVATFSFVYAKDKSYRIPIATLRVDLV